MSELDPTEVHVIVEKPVEAPPPRQSPKKTSPKWEQEARDRLRVGIRRYMKPLADMVARDANEGDTRLLVTDILCDALGFDKFEDLTTEYAVKGEFADYGVRIDKQLVAFIEVKRVTTKLNPKHLRQVEMYAVNEGVEWVMLTNGVVWQVYHLTGGLPVVIDLVSVIDLLSADQLPKKVDQMYYLTRESLKRRQIDELLSPDHALRTGGAGVSQGTEARDRAQRGRRRARCAPAPDRHPPGML